MDTVVDVIPNGEAVLAVKADPSAPVDLLGRQEIVDRIMKILEVISEKKSSCTFALNGAWGTGKTFVLNMLMNQLWEYHSDKYIVFHYNCWQYDYYEEPLIAIVAAMLDSVDEENHLLPANLRDTARAGMELAKPVLQRIAADFMKNKIGVDLTEAVSAAKDFKDKVDNEEDKRAEARSFDEFYSFKKAIAQAQKEIQKIAKDRTLVVVVDELDRCLPSYAIKVLERLHHLFAETSKSAVLIAVDKAQLDSTVLQIFGSNTDSTEYLRKFIDFELQLDHGFIASEHIKTKYRDFFHQYYNTDETWIFPYKEFISCLFDGVPIRVQEKMFSRLKIIHNILFPNDKKDFSFLCCELLWLVLYEFYDCKTTVPYYYKDTIDENGTQGFKLSLSLHNRLTEFFHDYWSSKYIFVTSRYSTDGIIHVLEGAGDMQLLLIYYLSYLYQSRLQLHTDHTYHLFYETDGLVPVRFRKNKLELERAINLLQILQ